MKLTVDLSTSLGPSSSGKTVLISSANAAIGKSGVRLGMNIYMKGKKFDVADLKSGVACEGTNMEMSISGTMLTITTDLAQNNGETSTGNIKIASSNGSRKIGKTVATIGYNVTHNKKVKPDFTKAAEGGGDKVAATSIPNCSVSSDDTAFTFKIDCDTFTGDAKSGKSKIIAKSDGFFTLPDDHFMTLMASTTQKKDVPTIKSMTAAVAESKNVEMTLKNDTLTVVVAKSGDFGTTTSGKATIVGSCKGTIEGSSIFFTIAVYTSLKDKQAGKRKAETPAVTEKAAKKAPSGKRDIAFDTVKAAVRVFMDNTEGAINVGKAYRALCGEHDWLECDELRSNVKKALVEVCLEETKRKKRSNYFLPFKITLRQIEISHNCLGCVQRK